MITFKKHVNLLNEAYYFLYFKANDKKIEDELSDIRVPDKLSKEIYDKKCEYFKKIYQHVENNMTFNEEEIEYFFKRRGEELMTYGALALCWRPIRLNFSLDDYEKEIKTQPKKEKFRYFFNSINQDESVIFEEQNQYDLESLISHLEATSFDSNVCFEIIKIYKNQRKYFDRVKALMEEVIKLIGECREEIDILESEFHKYWSKVEEQSGVLKLLEEKLNIKWNHSESGTIVAMSITNFSGISILLANTVEKQDVVILGTILDKDMIIERFSTSKEFVNKIGKVLADRSKIDILEFLADKKAFGKEIAAELKLSTATISYHMSTLTEIGFVKLEVISGRVYYQLDLPKLLESLDNIKKYFMDLKS